MLLGASQVSLQGFSGVCCREHKFMILWLCPLPLMAVSSAVLFKASQPPLLVSSTMGRGEGRCFFQERNCFCPSYTLGHIMKTTAWPLHYHCSHLSHSEHRATSTAIVPVLSPIQPSVLIPTCHLQTSWCMDLSGVFVCWAGDPLLSYNCPICRFLERNNSVSSLCHNADIPFTRLMFMPLLCIDL